MSGRRGPAGQRFGAASRRLGAGALVLALLAAACGDDGDDAGRDPAVDGYEATIVRTADGVPHITGDTIADVTFGQGYASGEDRTCDLADQVVKIRGERSRHFGPGDGDEHIDSDVAWRTIGIYDRATADWEDASDEVVEAVTAYTAGWNAHMEDVGVDALSGWCAGEDWVRPLEPADVYAYGRSIALLASSGQVTGFIASAQPPGAEDESDDEDEDGTDEAAFLPPAHEAGSNGWAIGSERSAAGTGMLVANPHFPWDGELRFWEVHLTVPGELDAYGVQLSGLPGIGIGFNENVGWTHTISNGNRFTAYMLDLVEGDPTTYRYGDEEREMTAEELTLEVLNDDGDLEEVTRTTWSTHYGPVIDFPGLGWTEEQTLTFRDANLDNSAIFEQYIGMIEAEDLDSFIQVHQDVTGIPLFNTIATSSEGRAWYADTSATPNLSDDAVAAYEEAVESDPIVAIAADEGAVLLDGSDPMNEWVEVDGARSPGLVPYEGMPQVERDDYVFNANDSFWMSHATEMLAGDYSPLHGRQETARTPRTRENATILDDTSADGPAGDDGLFTLDELADAAVQNTGYTARALREDVVDRCQGVDTVDVPADDDGGLPAETVDISEACDVLDGWDGVYDLDRSGAALWRETMTQAGVEALGVEGDQWDEPFDPERPTETPRGLAPAPDDADDPVLEWLGRAVQVLDAAGYPVDVELGEIQFAPRNETTVPIHGGDNVDGTTNIVSRSSFWSTLDPALDEERERVVPGTSLSTVGDHTGYLINNGASFIMALEFTDEGPQAKVFLTYGNPEDRDDPLYVRETERFSEKDWRPALLDEDAIEDAAVDTKTVTG